MWVDFCRVYTAFFVVLRHVHCETGTVGYYLDLFNYRGLIFFFFLVSGYFMHLKESDGWKGGMRRGWILLRVYLFWAVVSFLPLFCINHWAEISHGSWHALTVSSFMEGMGIVPCWPHFFPLNQPLWFLKTLFILSIISPWLFRLSSKMLVCLCVFCMACSDILMKVDVWEHTSAYSVSWIPPRTFESVMALAFYCGGILIRRHANHGAFSSFVKEHAWCPIVASLVLFPLVRLWGYDPPCRSSALVFLSVMTIMGIGAMVEKLFPRFFRLVSKLGPAAFFVYVTHFVFTSLFCLMEPSSGVAQWNNLRGIVLPVSAFGISLALYWLLCSCCPSFM